MLYDIAFRKVYNSRIVLDKDISKRVSMIIMYLRILSFYAILTQHGLLLIPSIILTGFNPFNLHVLIAT